MNKVIWGKSIAKKVAKLIINSKAYLVKDSQVKKDWIVWTNGIMSKYGFENKWGEFKKRGIVHKGLTDFSYLQNVAIEKNLMTRTQSDKLTEFYKSPSKYVW